MLLSRLDGIICAPTWMRAVMWQRRRFWRGCARAVGLSVRRGSIGSFGIGYSDRTAFWYARVTDLRRCIMALRSDQVRGGLVITGMASVIVCDSIGGRPREIPNNCWGCQ